MTQSHSRRQFERTHWSMAMRLDAPGAVDARAAGVELCLRSWYPIYAYLRCFGHGPESSREIGRDFLQHLFQLFRNGTAQVRGRFRHFLLARLREFLASDWRTGQQGDAIPELAEPPSDLEARHQRDNAGAPSPEQAYQQSFALELLGRALARLRDEAGQTGRLDMYDALEPFLTLDPSPAEGEELTRRLGTRSVIIVVALRRLRQRFRELIDLELIDTVASADEMVAEQQALFAVLHEHR